MDKESALKTIRHHYEYHYKHEFFAPYITLTLPHNQETVIDLIALRTNFVRARANYGVKDFYHILFIHCINCNYQAYYLTHHLKNLKTMMIEARKNFNIDTRFYNMARNHIVLYNLQYQALEQLSQSLNLQPSSIETIKQQIAYKRNKIYINFILESEENSHTFHTESEIYSIFNKS